MSFSFLSGPWVWVSLHLLNMSAKSLNLMKTILFAHHFDLDRYQSPEDLALSINEELIRGRLMSYLPKDNVLLSKLAENIPIVGKAVAEMITNSKKNERKKLADLLNMYIKTKRKKIVLVMDPFEAMERSDYEAFFAGLVHDLSSEVKIIVPQRPSDLLAASPSFLAIRGVTTNALPLEPLPREKSIEMARSLLPLKGLIWQRKPGHDLRDGQ